MPRIKISLPDSYAFTATVPVRITDLNYGGHVGNDAILSILQEARLQFLRHLGFADELHLGGVSLIMADVGIVFKGESFYGDVLRVQLAVQDQHKFGFDMVYRIQNQEEKEIAWAKTGMLGFNYDARKLTLLPPEVAARFETKTPENL